MAGLGQTPRRKKGFMLARKMRGFSLIEMMIVVALIMIVLAFSIMAIQPSLKQGHVTEAYNSTLMAFRQARDISVAQRQIYFVTLSNAAVPNSITITQGSTGTVTATYDTASKKFTYTVTYSGLTGPATAAHFHGPAAAGANAPPVVPIPATALASPIKGDATLTDAQAADLAGGKWYFNVHTAAHGPGEIRGQLATK